MMTRKFNGGGVNIYLVQLIVFLVPFFLPLFKFNIDTSTIITVISLLFAILAGFFIAAATSNHLRLQNLIAVESATTLTMFDLAKYIQPNNVARLANALDAYLIAVLDYELLDYAGKTNKEFNEILDAVDTIKPDNTEGIQTLSVLQGLKFSFISCVREMELTAKKIVTPLHWSVLMSLSLMLGVLLLGLRDGTILYSFVTSILLMALCQVLFLIQSVDSNDFLADNLGFETTEAEFEAMGKLPYFPEIAINAIAKIKARGKTYRVGYYKDISKSFDKEIRVEGGEATPQ
ncbi:MAG: hypothetical protein WC797_00040 [Candidatus Paceibacterota bacterium]